MIQFKCKNTSLNNNSAQFGQFAFRDNFYAGCPGPHVIEMLGSVIFQINLLEVCISWMDHNILQ